MKEKFLRKSVIISLLGHFTVFSIFSFSFGPSMLKGQYPNVSFWGRLLEGYKFKSSGIIKQAPNRLSFSRKPDTEALDKVNRVAKLTSQAYFKPQLSLGISAKKEIFFPRQEFPKPRSSHKEQAVIFYPPLPYNFTLYFKDRQVAHVELMFKGAYEKKSGFFAVKRRVSSGNLEVDLLSMRYISRYLFIQRNNITAADWRTVKIDLSAKND